MRPIKSAPPAWQMRSKGEQIKKQPNNHNSIHDEAHSRIDALGKHGLQPGQPRNALAHASVQILLNASTPMTRPALLSTLKTKSGFPIDECHEVIDDLVWQRLLVQTINDDGLVLVAVGEGA